VVSFRHIIVNIRHKGDNEWYDDDDDSNIIKTERISDSNNKRQQTYTEGADKSLARPTSRCILFDGENISFDASLVIYINSTNIPPIMIINRIYQNQNLLSL